MTTNLPSWAQELAGEHQHLGHLFGDVRKCLAAENDECWADTLLALLERVAFEVREHMEFEERDGYLAPVQERMPGLVGKIEQMRGEHVTLQTRLAQILSDVRAQPGVYAFRVEMSPHIERWLDSMRDHERRENILVQDALNTDISACD